MIVFDFAYFLFLVLPVFFYEALFTLRKLAFNDQDLLLMFGLQFLELVVETCDILLLFGQSFHHLLVSRSVVQSSLLIVSQLLLEPFSLLSGGRILLVHHFLNYLQILSLLFVDVLFFLL